MSLYVQYANSTKFQNWLYGTNDDVGLNSVLNVYWKDFYDNIFNIITCNIDGLNIWGQILNTSNNYYIGVVPSVFGFNVPPGNLTNYAQNFNHGTFTSGNIWATLPDGDYRCLLMLRAQTFISNFSILSITKLLNDFFINLQAYGTAGINYKFIVSVSVDPSQPHQINYEFKNMSTTDPAELPPWIVNIFSLSNLSSETYYLPTPNGTIPNITII